MANFPLQADSACATFVPYSFIEALAEYREARARFEEVGSTCGDDESRAVGTASDNALGRMIAAPSNTVADLATKLETMVVEYQGSEWDEDRVGQIAEDARRLASPRAQWDALVERLEIAETLAPVTDDSISDAGKLIRRIMAMPAPDAGAVRWKLDYVLSAPPGGSNDSFSADFLQQLVADYRCILGEV